jgi:hypothetical protein
MDSPTPQPLGQFIVDSPPAAPPQQFYAASAPQQYYEAPAAAKAYKVVPIPPKGNGNSGVLTALLIVLLVVAILYLCLQAQQYQGGRSLGNALASCGWVLYTRPGCTYCTKQMDALGEDTYPKQVVCVGSAASASGTMSDSQGPYLCKNVPAFPFWVNEYTSATRTGLQDRKQLRQMLRSPGS